MNQNSIIIKQGMPFIIPLGVLTLLFAYWGNVWIATILFLLTVFVTYFFRNPERQSPNDEKIIVSPADGKVISVDEIKDNSLYGTPAKKISIFMNVFNVHVNRAPCSGTVSAIRYREGKFFSANLDKASVLNEKNSILIKTDHGKYVLVDQIAGLIARRIVCWLKEDMRVIKGERFGLIRFGSRLEVFLPSDTEISVKIGEKVRAGETIIGIFQ